MWMFGSGWNRQLNCRTALVALVVDLSQNISETEVAPDALVQKYSYSLHVHMVEFVGQAISINFNV